MFEIHVNDTVKTSDGQILGYVKALHSQPDPSMIDPKLKLFGEYLEVFNLDLADDFFIPRDYVAEKEQTHLILEMTYEAVINNTLSRAPQFIAHGQAESIALPQSGGSAESKGNP